MSVQFVIGSSGSGKSTYLYDRVIGESMVNPKKRYFFIVPIFWQHLRLPSGKQWKQMIGSDWWKSI